MTPDILRAVAVLAGALVIGISAQVGRLYFLAYRKNHQGPKGLLPKHVWLIALSYVVLANSAVVEIVYRIGEPLTWRIPVNLTGLAIGIYALWLILKFEQRRVDLATGHVEDSGTVKES